MRRCGIGTFTVIFVLLVFAWAYYVFVFRFIPPLLRSHLASGIVVLVVFHVLLAVNQTCFFRTMLIDPGGIPPSFSGQDTSVVDSGMFCELSSSGNRRICKKCKYFKPDRAHHCSRCMRCILKMDHHCPFVNNCVGFHNYKFFILFLTWTVILALYIAACLAPSVWNLLTQKDSEPDVTIAATFIMGTVFGIGLSLFAAQHYSYVLSNQTTIEALEKKSKGENVYNIGPFANFQQVFGTNGMLWFLPVSNSVGDGLVFPKSQTGSGEHNYLLTA